MTGAAGPVPAPATVRRVAAPAVAVAERADPPVPPGLTGWVTLAEPGESEPDERPRSLRRVLAPIVAAAVVVVIAVSAAGWLVGRHIAEQQAVRDVAELTDVLADDVIQPGLTDAMLTDPVVARRRLDPLVRSRLSDGALVRVKLWTPSGRIIYSDEPRLVGASFPLEADAAQTLDDARISAGISDLGRPENRYERDDGKLLEVYRPVWTPKHQPLLFEAYFRYDLVSQRSGVLWRGFGGVMLASLAGLMLLLVPLAWALLAAVRRGRRQRERLTVRALEASLDERRRIAAGLHDGIVQELVAASFAVAAKADVAAGQGDRGLTDDLESVAATLRDGIGGLRSLLVDIYPPSLQGSGLAAALRDLARTTVGLGVVTDIDDAVADTLDATSQEAAYRVAQEALRNASKHASADHVSITLHAMDEVTAGLEIDDDGRGFRPQPPAPRGTVTDSGAHFGLRLMTDAARRSGARLLIRGAPGRGTTIRMELIRT
jgi:two-component system NarL family sensor kinase